MSEKLGLVVPDVEDDRDRDAVRDVDDDSDRVPDHVTSLEGEFFVREPEISNEGDCDVERVPLRTVLEYDVDELKELLCDSEKEVDSELLRVMESSSEFDNDDEAEVDGDVVSVGVGRSSVLEFVRDSEPVPLDERAENDCSLDSE